jgi:biopolymer transport protein ExbD
MRLVEHRFGYPLNLVIVDRSGALLWNGVPVERRRLEDYVAAQAQAAPPPFLVVTPERDAPCALVQETLSIALRAGRCRPDRCVFE